MTTDEQWFPRYVDFSTAKKDIEWIIKSSKRFLKNTRASAINKDYFDRETKLCRIHLQIVKNENSFFEEREKWLGQNKNKNLLDTNPNLFFLERRKWEIDFVNSKLQPWYIERHSAANGRIGFWWIAMLLDNLVRDQLTEEDGLILEHLINVQYDWLEPDLKGFKLEFTFLTNPYLQNKSLVKRFELNGENTKIKLTSIGTEVEWISDCPLTLDQRSKSFFTTFFDSYSTVNPLLFDPKVGEIKGKIPKDYRIGTIIRDKIIPHATYGFLAVEHNPYDDYELPLPW